MTLATHTKLDVRDLAPRDRHPLIFGTLDRLAVGATVLLVNDHDPKPLYYQLQAESGGDFSWEYVEEGPEVWQVAIGRIRKESAPATCGCQCGHGS